jgi:hypothetical protein
MAAKLAKFNITIKSQQARTGAPLSPLLGQYGINCQEFCNLFNLKTGEISVGIPVRIFFRVLSDKKYEFVINRLVFGKLMRTCGLSRRNVRSVDLLTFFKMFLVTRTTNMAVLPTEFSGISCSELRSLVYTIKSSKLRIK